MTDSTSLQFHLAIRKAKASPAAVAAHLTDAVIVPALRSAGCPPAAPAAIELMTLALGCSVAPYLAVRHRGGYEWLAGMLAAQCLWPAECKERGVDLLGLVRCEGFATVNVASPAQVQGWADLHLPYATQSPVYGALFTATSMECIRIAWHLSDDQVQDLLRSRRELTHG